MGSLLRSRSCRRCSLLLLDAVVAGEVEAFGVVGLEVGVGRRGAELGEGIVEVVFKEHEWEARAGMLVKACGDEHGGGEENGTAPELCQECGLDAGAADELAIGDGRDGWDDLGEGYFYVVLRLAVGADRDWEGLAVEIAGGEIPVLSFAAIGRELEGTAVGHVEGFIQVEHGLHGVGTGGEFAEVRVRVSGGAVVDGDGAAWLGAVEGETEDVLRARGVVDLHAGFGGGVVGEQEQEAAVERAGMRCAFAAALERTGIRGEVHADALCLEGRCETAHKECGHEGGQA